MTSQALVFFTDWNTPAPLLVVALHSLQRFYKGNIHVFYGENTPPFFIDALLKNSRISTQLVRPNYREVIWAGGNVRQCWAIKPSLHKLSPFNLTLFYDCDHVFLKEFDLRAFELINKHELITFHHPKEIYGKRVWRRINGRASVIRDLLKLPCLDNVLVPANGGCVGSKKGTNLLNEWTEYLRKFATCGNWALTRLPDEFALSYTLSRHNVPIENHRWSYSPQPDLSDLNPLPDIIAIHFCNTSYRLGSYYKTAQEAALKANYMGLKTNWEEYIKCNSVITEAQKAII